MAIKKPKKRIGKTTSVNNHRHSFSIDSKSGDGKTSNNNGHIHKIVKFKVAIADGHKHQLRN